MCKIKRGISLLVMVHMLFHSQSATGEDSLLGKKVFLKAEAVPELEKRKVDLTQMGFPDLVEDVKGEMLFLGRVWVKRSEVMNTDEALEYFTKIINNNPKSDYGYRFRGAVWNDKGEFDKAITDLTQAIKINPNYNTYLNRGNAWNMKKEYDRAIADYDESIRLNPTNLRAYANRGTAWSAKGVYDRARNDYSKAVELDPEEMMSRNNLGEIKSILGDFEEARKDFDAAVMLDPRNGVPLYNRGISSKLLGDVGPALADFDAAVNMVSDENPSDTGPEQIRGKFKSTPGTERRIDSITALALDASAWVRATSPDEKIRDGSRAVKDATKACELTTFADPLYLDTLAAAYAEQGNFDTAIRWQSKAVDLSSANHKREFEGRLALYREKKPYRETTVSPK